MTKDDLVSLLALAEDMALTSPESSELIKGAIRRISELEVLLAYLRDRPGECLGDNPIWMAKVESMVGHRKEGEAP